MAGFPLAVVAALDDEIRIIKSRMAIDSRVHVRPALFTLGQYENKPLLLVRGGLGMDAMRRATEYLLERYKPKFCLHVGYCGSADPRFGPGDLVIAEAVVNSVSGDLYSSPKESVDEAIRLCKEKGLRFRKGVLVTVSNVINSPHEKAFVGTQNDAQAIDMESAVFAEICAERGFGYLVVRAVLDPLDVALPQLEGVLDESGQTDPVALTGHVIKRPKDILKLPKLQYFAMQARQAITAFVDAWHGGAT